MVSISLYGFAYKGTADNLSGICPYKMKNACPCKKTCMHICSPLVCESLHVLVHKFLFVKKMDMLKLLSGGFFG